MDEDDFFSDDGLDAFPDSTLKALEDHAISKSTQRPNQRPGVQPLRYQAHKSTSLTKTNNSGTRLDYRPTSARASQPEAPGNPAFIGAQSPSSEYGVDDEDVIDLDELPVALPLTSRPSNPQNAVRTSPARYGAKSIPDPETAAAFAAADANMGSYTFGEKTALPQRSHVLPGAPLDVSILQARITELEAEQSRLRQSEQDARDAAEARKGEIAIIRSNLQKTTRTFEDRIAVMQRVHAQETAKQKAELAVGKKEREKMQTDNRFLQHEAAQEAERAKTLNGPARTRNAANRETPRKITVGDGFDDVHVRAPSPCRSKDRSREHTPKVGAKRKRPAQDSPLPLVFPTEANAAKQDAPPREHVADEAVLDTPILALHRGNGKYEYLQTLFYHRPHDHVERSVELLVKFRFPSIPVKSVSTLLMDEIACFSADDVESLALQVTRLLLNLWDRCFPERYFAPFCFILDLLRCSIHFGPPSLKTQLLEQAVPLCTKTIDLVTLPTARASTSTVFAAKLDYEALDRLKDEIRVDEVLEFMKELCEAATLTTGCIEAFWSYVEWDSLMMMLNKAQAMSHITMALQTLRTSATTTAFGPVHPDVEMQAAQEKNTVDKLSVLLFEVPIEPKDEPAYSDIELAQLRIEILCVFREMCQSNHAGALLAHHRFFIGRLVRFLHGQTCKLYSTRPPFGTPPDDAPWQSLQPLIVRTINMGVRILYHILRAYEDTVNLGEKFQAVVGGYHKFLIGLTRIAFGEHNMLGSGIEDEVAEAAHTILDNVTSPEEGEAIIETIETPRGTRRSIAEEHAASGEGAQMAD